MSFDLVSFGDIGDLTWRKPMPAMFEAFRHGKLGPAGSRRCRTPGPRNDDVAFAAASATTG